MPAIYQWKLNFWSAFPSFHYNLTSNLFFEFGLDLDLALAYAWKLRLAKHLLWFNIFVILGRLNYSAYLIHMLVLLWFLNNSTQVIYHSTLNLLFYSNGVAVVTFIWSIPFSLMCEVPSMDIVKHILFPLKKRENKAHTN